MSSETQAPAAAPSARPARRRGYSPPVSVASAVVFATVCTDDGSPAAAMRWDGQTILHRLLDQLADVGVPAATVIARPGGEAALRGSLAATGMEVDMRVCDDAAADLRAVAEIAGTGIGGIVLLAGEIVTQREALAGLLLDPRLRSAALMGGGNRVRPFTPRLRSVRGRVLSAGSPYHAVGGTVGNSLSIVKVAATERPMLAEAAESLAALAAEPPASWLEEQRARTRAWRRYFAIRAYDDVTRETVEEDPAIPPGDEAEVQRWVRAAPDEVVSLLLVGLVRGGAAVTSNHLRSLYWARPLSPAAVARAAEEILDYDEDKVLLEAAVKSNDGFFTTYFVSTYSRYVARWAAHRGWTPNFVTTLSVVIGGVAALCFATGDRWGMIAGAVLVYLSFVTDCVDGQLARYTRQFSALGAWLDSVFDRTKEYMVFAGLAVGSATDVWLLAAAALSLQTVRHTLEFSYGATRHQTYAAVKHPPLEQAADEAMERRRLAAENGARPRPRPEPRQALRRGLRGWSAIERVPGVRWLKKMIAFPIGERFATISITAAIWDAKTTFVVYLAWAGLATVYNLVGRVLRSVAR
jgi:hypothetical protein